MGFGIKVGQGVRGAESTEVGEIEVRPNQWLVPLLYGWADVCGVQFVSRHHGPQTTATVSRDSLLDLMRAVQIAERTRLRGLVQAVRDANHGAQERAWIALTDALEEDK